VPFCWRNRDSGCERESCSDVKRRTEQKKKLCSMWVSPQNDGVQEQVADNIYA
jgi:hypothetical protein